MQEKNNNPTPEENNAPDMQSEEMAPPTPQPGEPPQPEGGNGDQGTPLTMSETEIAEGKAFAILSYVLTLVGLPFFIIPLIMRNNAFALYHAKQSLMVWIIGAVGAAVGSVLTAICIGIIILVLVPIFLLVINIIGLINAAKGVTAPLPLVGQFAEDWFKGITKVQQ